MVSAPPPNSNLARSEPPFSNPVCPSLRFLLSTSMDELLARHRKELRDLQSQITQKKKQATKKNRKAINADCDALESSTRARHAAEISALASGDPSTDLNKTERDADEGRYIPPPSPEPDEEVSGASNPPAPPLEASATATPSPQPTRKPNRQKARLARRAAEMEAASAAAAAETASQPSLRSLEITKMASLIRNHNLAEHQIAPDGHCLYSAFSHALGNPAKDGYKETRRKCGEFMLGHRDDFEAFLEEPIESHVEKVMGTAEWGGQAEVMALGRAYDVRVNVLQAEGRVEKMNEEAKEGEVWLAYYRHSYGLGEHYNVLMKKEGVEGGLNRE
ncbi:cysteine proteinase [Ascodesmis nigricans]|uniref:Cysteine proteinase n=1 Tax=Ascodesmis nigricans TaxID=341454 RepID=A0A4S2N5V4_9PEZI|nr:cysteine proteinase [Ascodesmis nigricans]